MSGAPMDAWARARMRDDVDDLADRLRVHGGTGVGIGPLVDEAIAKLRALRDERDREHRSSVENRQRSEAWQREAIKMRSQCRDARLALSLVESAFAAAMDARDEALARADGLAAKINTPELLDFHKAVIFEAVHQRERWGSDHDAGKTPADWFWLVGYLAGKALAATKGEALPRYRHVKYGTTYEVIAVVENENNRGQSIVVYRGESDGKRWARPAEQFFDGRFEELPAQLPDKLLHHIITTAAACANWHAHVLGKTNLRPGIAPPPGEAP